MKRLFYAVIALCCLFFAASAQPAPRLTLVDAPRVNDNEIALGVRLAGVDARQVAALGEASFSLDEPYTDLVVRPVSRLPIALGVLVNLSANSELLLIQRTLHAYFDAHYRDGDTVSLTLLTVPAPYTIEMTNKAEIDALINGMVLSPVYYSISDALPSFATTLEAMQAADPDRPVMGLFVTSFINNAGEVPAADSFIDSGIPLHIVQAHTFRESFTENLRTMALRTGGIFVNNQAGLLATGDTPSAIGALKVLYDALDAARIVFEIRYTSTAIDMTREPTVNLSVQLGSEQILTVPFTYTRQFEPPLVEFVNPAFSASRRPSRIDGGGTAFDTGSQEIAVYVRFPDAVPRRIETLQLEVADLSRNTVTQAQLLTNPQPDISGAYRIAWELDDYSTPGTNTPVIIRVTVTDELGLTARAELDSSVTVAALPPLPTATFTPIPTATRTPVPPTETAVPPTAIPTAAASNGAGTGAAASPTRLFGRDLPINIENLTVILSILVVTLVGLAAALMLRLRRVGRRLVYADSRMDMPTPLPEGDAQANVAPAEEDHRTLGRLIVKRGLPAQEIPVDSAVYVIGRRAGEGINFVIDAPFISPRHCMLTFRNNRFLIRDLGSKNGTFVNGERILPERDTIVPNGSEVEITRQIVFELWDPDTIVRVDYQMEDAHTERIKSRISTTVDDSVAFPSALGIRAAADDDGEIGEDYSPV